MDPAELRASIPALQDCTYLNTGATGPSPRPVVEAATDYLERQRFAAPCGDGGYAVASEARESARETVADFINATPEEVALTRNTVEGINHVISAIDWEPGDVVVRTDLEHPAGNLPLRHVAEREGVEVRVVECEDGRLDMDALREAVTDARLLVLSSISWNYGTQLPVAEATEIAHDAGAQVLVDAVQSPGQVPVDVEAWGADFVAASGHKWLLGLWGSGFLYVDEDALPALEPERIGYFSVENPTAATPEWCGGAARFELGTTALEPYVALETAIDTIESVGLDTVQDRVERLTDRLKDGLGDRLLSPRQYESGLVTFAAEDPVETVERAASEGVQIRPIPEPHACRASIHAFNDADDVDRLLAALD
ncbi:aminotransferase class V-fold PLP-dependent enzyme [Halobacteriales archaeon Cl-PHB]